jgi:hypothetical protein
MSEGCRTGLWFRVGRGGRAKLHGRERVLGSAPRLLPAQLDVAEIEYVPELGVRRLREARGGWRDMEREEVRAADELLQLMLPAGET